MGEQPVFDFTEHIYNTIMAKKGNNLTLRAAKRKGNDEFYTRLVDIQNELRVYGLNCRHFQGKTVLCPCDESEHTNFGKHFTMNFEEYVLKRLVCIGYRTNRPAEVHIIERTADGIIERISLLKVMVTLGMKKLKSGLMRAMQL